MGILNITPDSFLASSRTSVENGLLQRAEQMIAEGADILDFGGQSTRPGAERLDAHSEMARVIPAIKMVREAFPKICISIDTFYSEVAEAACAAGANIINDISAGRFDGKMPRLAAEKNVPVILMHIKGTPRDMQ